MTLAQHPEFKHLFIPAAELPPDALPIPSLPDYKISPLGIVYDTRPSIGESPFRPICHLINNLGYVKANLRVSPTKRALFSVHRLSALTFIPNPDPLKTDVDHIDGNKLNNAPSNLRWVTHKENLAYARQRLGNWAIRGNPNHCSPVTAYHLDPDGNKIDLLPFNSIVHATTHFNKKYASLSSAICRAIRNNWLCCGYLWERA